MAFTSLQGQWRDRFGVTGGNGAGVTAGFFPGNPFPAQNVVISFGTTSFQCNAATVISTAVTAANTRAIDLTGLKALDGTAMTLTKVKTLQVAVTATAATTGTDPMILIGPLSATNGAVLGFGTTTAGIEVRRGGLEQFNPVSGWGVTASNKVLVLSNPGAYDITASIFITGTT